MRRRGVPWAAALVLFILLLQAYHGLSDVMNKPESPIDVERDTQNPEAETCQANDPQSDNECGIWLAKSTLPDAGLGMFAGREFHDHEELLKTGDIVIPIVDFELNQMRYHYKFLWDHYTWHAESTLTEDEGFHGVSATSPGFGSCANSYLDLLNVEQWRPLRDGAGLDRRKDPGAGASSSYHNRRSTAKGHIKTGQELFISYGPDWFESRHHLGPIPLAGDHSRGQDLLNKFRRLQLRINATHILKDMWEQFIWNSPYRNESRIFNALPTSWKDMEYAMKHSLSDMQKEKHRVTREWLQQHGTCMDNMRVDRSTIPQAGRGAFATRFLRKGTTVAPLPLIHIPHKERFQMYNITNVMDANGKRKTVLKDRHNVTHLQLMTNYCFGHVNSTLLLCPYGAMTAAINHNQTQANLKLQWGDPDKTGHHSGWLNLTIMSLIKEWHAGLVMELVATRDIEPGDELFMDYGDEWENAWKKHVKHWKPAKSSFKEEATADMLNADYDSSLKTVFEQMKDPYPEGIKVKCEGFFRYKGKWRDNIRNHSAIVEQISYEDDHQYDCDILRREQINGTFLYTAMVVNKERGQETTGTMLKRIPREAFVFVYKPYASDMHLPNAFRHSIMIPDEMFPEQWKNLAVGNKHP